MLSDKKYKFLDEVLCYVKFPFDRDSIRDELKAHIEDKIDYYTEQGYDAKTAEELSINDMGDPKEIGTELNKQHSPLLGWVWKITNVMVILFVGLYIFAIGSNIINFVSRENPINDIPKSIIIYKIHVDKKVKLDNTVIRIIDLVYEEPGTMNILWEYYDTKLWLNKPDLIGIGTITDNLGNEYLPSSTLGGHGIKSRFVQKFKNFSKEANTLTISYDRYNRKYRLEIPLEVGDKNE